jgi:hypothetical protein
MRFTQPSGLQRGAISTGTKQPGLKAEKISPSNLHMDNFTVQVSIHNSFFFTNSYNVMMTNGGIKIATTANRSF